MSSSVEVAFLQSFGISRILLDDSVRVNDTHFEFKAIFSISIQFVRHPCFIVFFFLSFVNGGVAALEAGNYPVATFAARRCF